MKYSSSPQVPTMPKDGSRFAAAPATRDSSPPQRRAIVGQSMIHIAENPKAVLDQRVTRDAAERNRESHRAAPMLRRWSVESGLDVKTPLSHRSVRKRTAIRLL